MDGLHAARLVTCIWGGIWLIAAAIFFDRFTTIHRAWKILALAILAVFIAEISARQITPDIMLAACLLIYFSITLAPDFLRRPRLQLAAGLVGGFAYLAKAYALPFVLVHLPITIVIRRYSEPRDQRPPILLPLMRAFLGLAIFSLPWIAANSVRFGHLTISTAGKHAHTDVGPPEIQAKIPALFGRVEDPYITRHETKESLDYPRWSPFQSRKYFMYQLHVAVDHARALARSISLFDRFYLSSVAALLAIVMICNLINIDFPKWKIIWLLMTAVLFCSGMLLVFFTSRYVLPLWSPLLLALGLSISLNHKRFPRLLDTLFAAAILLSFSIAAIANLRNTEGKPPAWRKLAAALHEHGIHGPLASADRHQGLFVAFFASEKFVGFPSEDDAGIAQQKLIEQKPAALLIFKGKRIPKDMQQSSRLAAQIAQLPQWKLAFEFPVLPKQNVAVYVPITSTTPSFSP
jgi:hypothetical protein